MGRRPVPYVKNIGGYNGNDSPFLVADTESPNCRGCHVDSTGKICKRLGLSRVVTDGSDAGWNIYRSQGGRGLFVFVADRDLGTLSTTTSVTASLTKTATTTTTGTLTLTKTDTVSVTGTDTASVTKTDTLSSSLSNTKTITATRTGTATVTQTIGG